MDQSIVNELVRNNLKLFNTLNGYIDNIDDTHTNLGILIDYENTDDTENFTAIIDMPYKSMTKNTVIRASLLKNSYGELVLPEIGEMVLVHSFGGIKEKDITHFYTTHSTLNPNPFRYSSPYSEYFSTSRVGFTRSPTQTYKGYVGGRYIKKVLEKRGRSKILNSTDTFIVYQDEDDKLLEIRCADDYVFRIHTGDNGTIKIGFWDEINDVTGTGSTDIEIDAGISGDIDLKSISGNITIETTSGDLTLKSTTGLLKFVTNDDIELDPGSGKKVWVKGDLYVDGDIKWNYSSTPTTASTHIHGTGTGPSAAPNPGS